MTNKFLVRQNGKFDEQVVTPSNLIGRMEFKKNKAQVRGIFKKTEHIFVNLLHEIWQSG